MRVCSLLIIAAIALSAWDPILAHGHSAGDSAKKARKHAGEAVRQWAKDAKGAASDAIDEAVGDGKDEYHKARDKGRRKVADAADDVAGAAEKLRDKAEKEL